MMPARPRPRKTPQQQEQPSFLEVVKDAETGAYQWKNPGKPNRRRKSTKRATHSTGADWLTMQGGSSMSFKDPCYSDADEYTDADACSPSNLESERLKRSAGSMGFLEAWRIGKLFKQATFALLMVLGGTYQDAAALSTGESMEQFFSYLAKCGITTKNMNAADTSKKRIQLRKTMSSNKSSLGVTIEKYNVVARLQEAQHKDLIMEDVLCGKFQWNKDPECKERVSEGVFLFKNVLGNSEVFNDQDEVEDDEFEDEDESEEEEENENESFEKLLLAKEVLTTEEADIIAEEITLEGNESEETVPVDNDEAIETDEVATTDEEAIDTEEVAQVDKRAGDTEESTTQDKEGEGAKEVATEDKKAND
eukprot:gene2811-biopygen2322